MKAISVPDSMAAAVQAFLDEEKIPVEIVVDGRCDVKVLLCNDRRESDLDTMYSGGWISCETARAVAARMVISLSQMGALLDHLDVKVRKCGLGCFK
jgi:hypothetical protein